MVFLYQTTPYQLCCCYTYYYLSNPCNTGQVWPTFAQHLKHKATFCYNLTLRHLFCQPSCYERHFSVNCCLNVLLPSSLRDSIDIALFLKLRESVDWDRILRNPRGESSFRVLQHIHRGISTYITLAKPMTHDTVKLGIIIQCIKWSVAMQSPEMQYRESGVSLSKGKQVGERESRARLLYRWLAGGPYRRSVTEIQEWCSWGAKQTEVKTRDVFRGSWASRGLKIWAGKVLMGWRAGDWWSGKRVDAVSVGVS